MEEPSSEMSSFMSEIYRAFPNDHPVDLTSVVESNNTPRFNPDTSYMMDTLERPLLSREMNTNDAKIMKTAALDSSSYSLAKSSGNQPRKHPSKKQGISRYDRFESNWWMREVASLLSSYVLLIGVVVVLNKYDGLPLHSWPVSISLNTFLAVFTTLAKAGLVYPVYNCIGQLKWIWFSERTASLDDFVKFDEASRGILGAIGLIGRLKGGHIASIGAFVSILAIGTSPITQQLIAYEIKLVVSTEQSLLAQVPTSDYFEGSVSSGGTGDHVSIPMKQAINSALFSSSFDQILPITPTCPTGNCTWQDYDSLAMCSGITNVTDLLSFSNRTYIYDAFFFNVTLKKNVYLEYGQDVTSIVSWTDRLQRYGNNSEAGAIASSHAIIYETSAHGGIDPYEPQFAAIRVDFYWCVNTYRTTTTKGLASTNVTIESRRFSIPPEIYFIETLEYNFTLSSPNDKNYTVYKGSHHALGTLLNKQFKGTYKARNPSMESLAQGDAAYVMQPMLQANTSALVLEGISNYTRNMATSMTNAIRTHIGNSSVSRTNYVNGTAKVMETYIHIRWGWISLLAGLIILSTILLLATMIKTKLLKIEAMRSSSLAALTILSMEAKEYMGSTALQNGSVKRSEELRVRLRRGSGGWSLDRVG